MRTTSFACLVGMLSTSLSANEPAKLIAHWPFTSNATDVVGNLHGPSHHIECTGLDRPAAKFNGRDSFTAIPDGMAMHLGVKDFSLALWLKTRTPMTNTLGECMISPRRMYNQVVRIHLWELDWSP